jgi:isopentenyldiphosphate isomerase
MEEWVDICDAEGKPTGKTVLKSEAHRLGLWHPTVHIWCYTASGKILLQKRAEDKETFPGLWDVSVAGHIEAGEAPKIAALREMEEEIGLRPKASALELLGVFPSEQQHPGGITDREFHHSFLCEMPTDRIELRPQVEEVAAVRWIPLIQFAEEIWGLARPGPYVPHSREYYTAVIREIRSRL